MSSQEISHSSLRRLWGARVKDNTKKVSVRRSVRRFPEYNTSGFTPIDWLALEVGVCYEAERRQRVGRFVRFVSKRYPKSSLHWKSFHKAATMCHTYEFDPRLFVTAQFEQLAGFDKVPFPQPSHLASSKAWERMDTFLFRTRPTTSEQPSVVIGMKRRKGLTEEQAAAGVKMLVTLSESTGVSEEGILMDESLVGYFDPEFLAIARKVYNLR